MTRRAFLVLLCGLLFLPVSCSKSRPLPDATSERTVEPTAETNNVKKVGFDIDDTLLFSSPAFDKGEAEADRFGTDEFWSIVNGSDRGLSLVKKSVLEIVIRHQRAGDRVYAITARRDVNGDLLREFIEDTFGIDKDDVYFEPNGKVDRIRSLGVSIFYGDSDGDIQDAQEAGAEGLRIERSPKSGYKRKYNPGKFNEKILKGTEE